MVKGVADVSEKITKTDIENIADDILIREMKKADKSELFSYEEGKKEFERIKKNLRK